MEKGADVNSLTSDQMSPLHFAASYDNEEMVLLLLQVSADFWNTTSKTKARFTLSGCESDRYKVR